MSSGKPETSVSSKSESRKDENRKDDSKKVKEVKEAREVREAKEDKKRKEVEPEDSDSDAGSDYSDDSEYSELDLTDNPMYQVLSAFFEDEEGNNICNYLKELTDAVRENTKMLSKYIKESKSDSDSKKRH